MAEYIAVFIRKKPQKLLKNWDCKPAEVPKSDTHEREDPTRCCAKQFRCMGTTGRPPTCPQRLCCHHSGPGTLGSASGSGFRGGCQGSKKKPCCHRNPPASPLAPGGEGQEMPREEQQDKVTQARSWFAAGLVGEGWSAGTGEGETRAPRGKELAQG